MYTDTYTTVGGVTVTADLVRDALAVLREAPGVMVRQPLAHAGNPLSAMDYHGVSREELTLFPELEIPPATRHEPAPHVKTAVIHCLERVLRELEPYIGDGVS